MKRFATHTGGASFLEFAIIAVPLFTLIFGIIEVGLIFWGTYELENATADAARYVRTGQAQGASWDANQLKSQLCSKVSILTNCISKVQLDVQTYQSFKGVNSASPLDGKGALRTDFSYSPGGAGGVVLIRAYYEWTLINPLSSAVLANLADGNRLLQGTALFRNEPFSTN